MKLLSLIFILFPIVLYSKPNCCISNIYITGNKITREQIILRELPFEQGDSVNINDLEGLMIDSRNNLLNLSLFNYVYVTKSADPGNADNFDINIRVEERWYVWPMLSFVLEDRNLSNWLKEGDNNRVTIDLGLKAYNVLGLNHTLTASYKFGYQRGFHLEYENITLDHEGKHRLGFNILGLYSKTENFISLFNSPVYNNSDGAYVVKMISPSVNYTYRPQIRKSHNIALSFDYTRISDTILKLNPKYWGGKDTIRRGIGVNYTFTYDQRDKVQYPLKGYSFQGEFRGYMSFSNSIRYAQIRTNFQYYLPITERWNICGNLSTGFSKKNVQAYTFDKAIGYENVYLRGYEYYVNDGQHYVTFNPTLKYNLIPTKIFTMNFLSFLPQFKKIHFTVYAKAFFDMGYSYQAYPHISNFLSNKFLCSGGAGLDIISYYDINFSIEYSFNQLSEHGLFFTIKSVLF